MTTRTLCDKYVFLYVEVMQIDMYMLVYVCDTDAEQILEPTDDRTEDSQVTIVSPPDSHGSRSTFSHMSLPDL